MYTRTYTYAYTYTRTPSAQELLPKTAKHVSSAWFVFGSDSCLLGARARAGK